MGAVISHSPLSSCPHHSICTYDPLYKQWLISMGVGAVPFITIIMGAWLLAPGCRGWWVGVVIADHTRVHRTTIYSELIPT